MSADRASLHLRLRAETAEAHRRLEQDLDWEARVATRAGYRDLLAGFHGFHAMLEPAIAGALGDPAFLAPRLRLARLAADLEFLGLDADAVAALPRPEPLALSGPSAAMGAFYVLEGSTLGGQVIGRHILRLHGYDAAGGAGYYAGHGRATGAMWTAFRDRLDGVEDAPAAIRAANATFAALGAWMCRAAPRR